MRRRLRPARETGDGLGELLAGLDSNESWNEALDRLHLARPEVIESAERHLSEEEVLRLLTILVHYVGAMGFVTPERKAALFDRAQTLGVHVLPVHYSSPIPDTRELPEGFSARARDFSGGLTLDLGSQLELLTRLGRWAEELADVPEQAASGFYWDNTQLYRNDATAYYGMIRELRPQRVVEVGGGFSTMIASRACVANGSTDLVCVEPWPRPELRNGLPCLGRLIESPVQDVAPDLFLELRAGDLLFIDGSHVSRAGSDVNYLLLSILPRLARGVVVHVHDVFTPWEYPEHWITEQQIFWNEQYLLEAFLLYNGDFEPLCFMNFLGKTAPEAFRAALGLAPNAAPGGSSAWLRRAG
jgi:Methyltransferase domain